MIGSNDIIVFCLTFFILEMLVVGSIVSPTGEWISSLFGSLFPAFPTMPTLPTLTGPTVLDVLWLIGSVFGFIAQMVGWVAQVISWTFGMMYAAISLGGMFAYAVVKVTFVEPILMIPNVILVAALIFALLSKVRTNLFDISGGEG